jgi:hypothetical protein
VAEELHPAVAPDGAGWLFGDAADSVEVVRRLWDSWEDDGVIRDVATGRSAHAGGAAHHLAVPALRDLLGLGPARPAADWASARKERVDA